MLKNASSPITPLLRSCSTLYCPKNSIVLLLVRWMPIWPPRINPKRYSRPICAPESRPKRSLARSPKSPAPSGRPNRCVTRNALLNRGTRSVVGRLTMVKSGWLRFGSRSGSSSGAGAGAGFVCAPAACGHMTAIRVIARNSLDHFIGWLLVVARAKLDPALDHQYLTVGQIRWTDKRHPHPHDARTPFELVNQVAVLRVAGDDANRADLAAARDSDQVGIRHLRREIEPVEQPPDRIVTLRAGGAARRIAVAENLVLDTRERRDQIRCWPGDAGQRFITCRAADADGEQCCAGHVPIHVHLTS